jgi:hypothetical protein
MSIYEDKCIDNLRHGYYHALTIGDTPIQISGKKARMARTGHTPEPLTEEEEKAIASLKRLAKKWPESLWLFSASGTLTVMKKYPGNDRYPPGWSDLSGEAAVTTINIENDGGDW